MNRNQRRLAAALRRDRAWHDGPRPRIRADLCAGAVRDVGMVDVALVRNFVDDKGVSRIFDCRTGSHEGGDLQPFLDRDRERYAQQLARYARQLPARDDRPVRCAVNFRLLGARRQLD